MTHTNQARTDRNDTLPMHADEAFGAGAGAAGASIMRVVLSAHWVSPSSVPLAGPNRLLSKIGKAVTNRLAAADDGHLQNSTNRQGSKCMDSMHG